MKILDLFNEYNLSTDMTGGEVEQPRTEKDRNTMSRIYKAYIVSKDFGWIKWLVENDKIDFEKYRIMDTRKYLHQHIIGNTCYVDIRADVPNYEFILALLSIQDEPIEFLISILK